MSGIDLNRAGNPAPRDRLRARSALGQGGRRLHAKDPHAGPLPRDLRRQHAGRLVPLRRQRLGSKDGRGALGTRAEVKNLNSFRFVERAINHEIERQIALARIRRAPWSWRRGSTIPIATRPAPCARRKRPTITAISPIPICLPLVLSEEFIEALRGGRSPSFPMPSASASSPNTGCRPYDAAVLMREPRARRLLRGGRRGERRTGQTLRQLGHGRGPGGFEPRREGDRPVPDQSDACSGAWCAASPMAPSPARSPKRSSRPCGRAKAMPTP